MAFPLSFSTLSLFLIVCLYDVMDSYVFGDQIIYHNYYY